MHLNFIWRSMMSFGYDSRFIYYCNNTGRKFLKENGIAVGRWYLKCQWNGNWTHTEFPPCTCINNNFNSKDSQHFLPFQGIGCYDPILSENMSFIDYKLGTGADVNETIFYQCENNTYFENDGLNVTERCISGK